MKNVVKLETYPQTLENGAGGLGRMDDRSVSKKSTPKIPTQLTTYTTGSRHREARNEVQFSGASGRGGAVGRMGGMVQIALLEVNS